MEMYKNNNYVVISDEIWLGILLNRRKHIPLQSISEDTKCRTVDLCAPSKTFNLTDLVNSYHITYSKYLRERIVAQSTEPHYNEMNVMSIHALIGAYKPEGYEWADGLCQVLGENVNYVCEYIAEHSKGMKVSKPEGTHILFVDCEEWLKEHGKTTEGLEKASQNVGMARQDRKMFHGPSSIRTSLALPLNRVREAFERTDKYVFNTQKGDSMGRLGERQNMPDSSFQTPFCPELTLKEFMTEQKTAIISLQYFGCMLCQYDMAQYTAGHEEIKATGGGLLVVLQSDPELLAQDLGTEGAMLFTIICDAEGELCHEYGILPAESKMEMAGAKTVIELAKTTAAGYRHGRYEREGLQLPTAFVVGGKGAITWVRYGTTAGGALDVNKLAGYLRKVSY